MYLIVYSIYIACSILSILYLYLLYLILSYWEIITNAIFLNEYVILDKLINKWF